MLAFPSGIILTYVYSPVICLGFFCFCFETITELEEKVSFLKGKDLVFLQVRYNYFQNNI